MYRGYSNSFHVFYEEELRPFLEERKGDLRAEVEGLEDNEVLNVSEDEMVKYLVAKYRLQPPAIHFHEVSVDRVEKEIPAELFPGIGYNVRSGKRYKKPVIVYYLPLSGEHELLKYRPSRFSTMTHEMEVRDGHLCFEVISFSGDPEEVKREAEERLKYLENQLPNLVADVEAYNAHLPQFAQQVLQGRKHNILDQHDLVAALEVPLREREDMSKTFAVPSPRDRYQIAVEKPRVTQSGFKPEPTLDGHGYRRVLHIIRDLLRVVEQHPALYVDRDEEGLRDQILLHLTPRFEWSATGETFNRKGKTDILLRYQGCNLFAAECKFWSGQKAYLKMLDQLLSYLTWRDSKAAAILFVRNKEVSSVLESIEEVTPNHSSCLGLVDNPEESWFNYRFHIIGDPNREVRLAVLCSHVPPVDDGH